MFTVLDYKIGTRLFAAILLPIIALTGFAGSMVFSQYNSSVQMGKVQELALFSPYLSNLVHELQKERGSAAGFLSAALAGKADARKNFTKKLKDQRNATDKSRKALETALANFDPGRYGAVFQGMMEKAGEGLARLGAKRKGVDELRLPAPEMATYYTGVIADMLDVISSMSHFSSDSSLNSQIIAYSAFLQAKERAGLERAMGAIGFAKGEFSAKVHHKYMALIAEQDAFLDIFKKEARKEDVAFFQDKTGSPIVEKVDQMRAIGMASVYGDTKGMKSVDGTKWFDAITGKINLYKQIEDHLGAQIISISRSKASAANTALSVIFVLTLIVLTLTILFAVFVARGIRNPIETMANYYKCMAKDDLTCDITLPDSEDEIGDMVKAARVFQKRLAKVKQLEIHTKEIGERSKIELEVRSLSQLAMMLESVNGAALNLTILDDHSLQVSRNGQTIASAAEELVASVDEISRNSEGALQNAQETEVTVSHGREATLKVKQSIEGISRTVGASIESLGNLADASNHIGQILGAIEDIAAQTNLLALNATIEAARAGEAGKGFAVVASEVKQLASQTTKATEDISERIGALKSGMEDISNSMDRSKEAVDGGLVAIEETTTTMDEAAQQVSDVNEKMREITGILGQQKTASAEIAESIGGVATLAQESKEQVTCISDMISSSNNQMAQSAGSAYQSGNDRSLCEMAKIDHIAFKKRVIDAVMGRIELHAGDIPDHHACRLGKWYDAVQQAEITGLPAFETLIAPHRLVHATAKQALEANDSGDDVAAMSALEEMNAAGSDVIQILNQLSDALEQVQKKAYESKAAA